MKSSFLRNFIIGMVAGLVVFAIGSNLTSNDELVSDSIPESDTVVSLISPSQLAKNSSSLLSYGTVEASQDLDLVFEMSGEVMQLHVHPGSYVQKGQILAVLENSSLAAQIKQAEAAYEAVYSSYLSLVAGANDLQLAAAESQLNTAELQLLAMLETRKDSDDEEDEESVDFTDLDSILDEIEDLDISSLVSMEASDYEIKIQKEVVKQYEYNLEMLQNGASSNDLDSAWAYVEQAQAGLEAARAMMDVSRLKAPFDGEIVSLDIQEGEYVMATVSVGQIVNRSDIEAITYLSSEEADSISVGNEVLIDDQYEAEVIGISSKVDEYTGKRKVRIQMEDLGDLTVGDTVELSIGMDLSSNITLVPLNAVVFDEDDGYVFFYYDGAVYRRKVNTGDVLGSYVEVSSMPNIYIVEIVSGLRNGQEVSLTL